VGRLTASLTIAALGVAGLVGVSSLDVGFVEAASERVANDRTVILRGAQLAAIGNCGSCHTRPGGEPYAGGLAMDTPFGTIHSTNITPDAATGIGNWSERDFLRAMHEGVAPAGRQLYPAFPYDHFTKVTDDDVSAIYAFVMTRDPVEAEPPPNKLNFPFNLRPLLVAWKALYLRQGVYQPDPSRSDEWNRGAYLVEGLGHCGACHTPRDGLGGEDLKRPFAGGEASNWHAPAMNAASPAPTPWTVDELYNYLRTGEDEAHGIAAGPMVPVVHNLAQVPERDVRAIAVYVASTMAAGGSNRGADIRAVPTTGESRADLTKAGAMGEPPGVAPITEGAQIYLGACDTCHGAAGAAPSMKTVPLEKTTSVNAPDPRNVIHIVMQGIWPQGAEPGALMPGFAGELTPQQTAALIEYLRSRFSTRPAWKDVPEKLRLIARAQDAR
jgi:mono/diheme cytochrome c family protein